MDHGCARADDRLPRLLRGQHPVTPGSGFPKDSALAPVPGRSIGWFVGWMERDGKAPLLFAYREIDLAPPGAFGGGVARKSFLAGLPGWLAKIDSKRKR